MKIRYLDIAELNDRMDELEDLNMRRALSEDERNEIDELICLRDQIGEKRGRIDDSQGPFIPEHDFDDYARELAREITPNFAHMERQWPFDCIDWEQAAKELWQDYTQVKYQGTTYMYRA